MGKEQTGIKIVAQNRRARRDYLVEDTYEAGLALQGTEVKSLRNGHCVLTDGYARPQGEELFLFDLIVMHPPYGTTISFSDDDRDLSNARSIDHYTELLYTATINIARQLKPGGYMSFIMGDVWSDNNTGLVPLAFLTMDMAMVLIPGARLKSIAVKDIVGNQAARQNRNLKLSSLFRWGANELAHETLLSIQRGLKT